MKKLSELSVTLALVFLKLLLCVLHWDTRVWVSFDSLILHELKCIGKFAHFKKKIIEYFYFCVCICRCHCFSYKHIWNRIWNGPANRSAVHGH